MPSREKTGGKVNYIQKKEAMCLTEKQTDYVYKTVEEGNIINTKTMMYETMQNHDDNPYKKVVLNKVYREEDKSPEMRNWSIFSDSVRYVQHEQKSPHKLNINTLKPDILKSKYLDMYEGVYIQKWYMPTNSMRI